MTCDASRRPFALALTVLFAALLIAEPPARSAEAGAPSAHALDPQAEQLAEAFVRSHFAADCNEDVFGKSGGRYWQYRGFGWSVQREALVYKDSVFGIEWKGHLEIRAAKYRTYLAGSGSKPGKWTAWRPLVPLRIYLQKKHGVWNIHRLMAADELPMGGTAPSCDEVRSVP